MKVSTILIILMISIFGMFFVRAMDQSIVVDYSFLNDSSVEKTVEFSSVLLVVRTDEEATCRYSSIKGDLYSEMASVFSSSGKLHEKSFTGLGDGVYRYYVKCSKDSGEGAQLDITLIVNSFVTAQIILSEEAPLKAGKLDVTLKTSKIVSQAPSLSYSFDGVAYNPVVLFGSGDVWRGYLIIPKDAGESVVSFKFRGNDLEGREGTEIISGGVYFVDAISPETITDITAIGYVGKIELDWHLDEDVREFNIYKSENPNPDYTDFYKSTESESFEDNSVEKGKTYYYRVSAVDEAGNEGDFSREVSATALLENGSSSGLSVELIGKVDNIIGEINSIISETTKIKNSISLKQELEKTLFTDLKLDKDLEDSGSELESLKREVSVYKDQDLSKEELESKLDSASLKLNIIKRKIPENLIIAASDFYGVEMKKENVEEAILELREDISEKNKQKSLEQSMKIIEDSGLNVTSQVYAVETVYIDGTKKEISVVQRTIEWDLEDKENVFFVETIPKDLAESVSELSVKSLDYRIVKEDPVLSFNANTKKIIYSLNKKVTLDLLKESNLVFVKIYEEKSESSSGVTSYFLFIDKINNKGNIGIGLGIIILGGMFIYFVYMRKTNFSENFIDVFKSTNQGFECLKKQDILGAKQIYGSIREKYPRLNEKEKKKIYKKIGKLKNKIVEKMKNEN